MNINIYGSTGKIGSLTLDILNKYFPKIKINLLTANKNYKKLLRQIEIFNPKYVYLSNEINSKYLKKLIKNKKTKLLNYNDLIEYLNNHKSYLSILSISGYNSLYYLESIFKNTDNLGLVNKECVVSAGHLFYKMKKKYKVNIFPLDSEHFSISKYFIKNTNFKFKKIYITASGGPFFSRNIKTFNKITFSEAIKHPKWNMGYKNSIDSATLANKCLEIIEAKYLFDIPFNKIDIIIHPESLIHSIVEFPNLTSDFNYFYHDMFIPIFNFLNDLNNVKKNFLFNNKFNLNFSKNGQFNFHRVDTLKFPIYKIFKKLKHENPAELIKFNCANEYAVELFKKNIIKFDQIGETIHNLLSYDINYPINTVKSIIEFQNIYVNKISTL